MGPPIERTPSNFVVKLIRLKFGAFIYFSLKPCDSIAVVCQYTLVLQTTMTDDRQRIMTIAELCNVRLKADEQQKNWKQICQYFFFSPSESRPLNILLVLQLFLSRDILNLRRDMYPNWVRRLNNVGDIIQECTLKRNWPLTNAPNIHFTFTWFKSSK